MMASSQNIGFKSKYWVMDLTSANKSRVYTMDLHLYWLISVACLEKADTCPWIEMDAWAWLPLLSSPRRLFLCCARWWWRWLVVAAQRATSNPASLTKADLLHTAQPPTGGLSTISHQNMTMLFWLLCIQSNTLSSDIIWYLFIFLTFSFLHDLNFHFSFRQKEQKMALMFSS